MSVFIEIRDTDNSIVGRLDVGNSDDFPFSLTRKLNDFTQLNSRSGVYSYDFDVPMSESLVTFLKGIYNANLKDVKAFFKDKTALVFSNNLQIASGLIRVLSVKSKESITLQFVGDNLTWVTKLSELSLNEVNFQDASFNFDTTSVKASWSNTADTNDYVFAAINRGGLVTNYWAWSYYHFRPDLFITRLLTNAFNTIGYTLSSSLLSNTGFKSLILPYFGTDSDDFTNTNADINVNKTTIGNTSTTSVSVLGYETRRTQVINNSYSEWTCDGEKKNVPLTYEFSDANGIYNNSTYIFSNFGTYGNWSFDYSFEITTQIPFADEQSLSELYFKVENLTTGYSYETLVHQWTGNVIQRKNGTVQAYIPESVDTKAYFYLKYSPTYDGQSYTNTECGINRRSAVYGFTTTNRIEAKLSQTITAGSNIPMAKVMPKEYKVLTLINDLTKMFNLYWRTDEKIKKVYFETRDTFFKNITFATDYTDKIDLSNKYELIDMRSIYKRYYDFEFAEDGSDGYVTEINKKNTASNQAKIGCVSFLDLGSDFNDGVNVFKNDSIAATAIVEGGSYAPYVSRLWTDFVEDPPQFNTQFSPRILSYNYAGQVTYYGLIKYLQYFNDTTNSIDLEYTIPYALPYSVIRNGVVEAPVPQVCTYATNDKDLSTTQGFVKDYWSQSIQFIKRGKVLKIKMLFSYVDFFTLDFRNPIYFSAPEEIQGYWIFESLNDYKVSQNQMLINCVLHKFENNEALTIPKEEELPRYPPREDISEYIQLGRNNDTTILNTNGTNE